MAAIATVTGLAAAGLTLPLAGSAMAAPTTRADFNGDGYDDVVVGMPKATVDGKAKAGYVNVLWGSANGPAKSTVVSQSTAGVPGTSEAGDLFGTAVAVADLNGDGYGDLAVSASGESLTSSTTEHHGTVTVVWGSASGFIKGGLTAAKGDSGFSRLGGKIATGDFDHDGDQDLALSASGEEGGSTRMRPGPFTAGSPTSTQLIDGYAFGGARALAAGDFDGNGTDDLAVTFKGMESSGTRVYSRTSGAWSTTWSTSDYGSAIATGDFDGDHTADLAIGLVQPNPEADGTFCADRLGGAIAVVYGKEGTTLGGNVACTTQSSPYVGGTAEAEDDFGASLSVANLDRDNVDELIVGVGHEAVGSKTNAGSYLWLAASHTGVMTGPAFSQDSAGVPGTAEAGDLFGAAVSAGDYNGDNYPDIAIGAPGENSKSGGVWFHPSREEGTPPPITSVTPGSLGLNGAVEHGGVLGR
ncbi:FG-GAP-like repeat-containing protein [Streptomyces lydicamycinicus]|uniref:Integrin-like protein n=2 Tax=Streptomyces lydicamycinicus TaxID=1546107 RepID=A0A0P4RHH8_9ACTN|nr:FG-GAP and VCBS repeat-containing protein [Streptomyces lydicamycinicus]GAO12913.1 hypothetical protein TPA0598_13_00970 [Streptomyces lydicamycinicus]